MAKNSRPASRGSNSAGSAPASNAPSPGPNSREKRPGSDNDQPNSPSGTGEQQTQEDNFRSSKRQKKNNSLENAASSVLVSGGVGESTGNLPTHPPQTGWNSLSRGLRTSFGARLKPSTDSSPKPSISPLESTATSPGAAATQNAPETGLEDNKPQTTSAEGKNDLSINLDQTQPNSPASEQQQRDSRQGSATSSSRGSQSQSSDVWVLPPVPSASEVGVDPKDDRGWEEMFLSWCRSLRQLNQGEIKAGTSRERHPLLEAYYRWVGKVNGLPKIKASAARRVASQYAQQNSEVLVNLFSNTASTVVEPQPSEPIVVPEKDEAQPPPPPSPPPPPMSPAPPLPPGPLPLIGPDAEYQERYYPGIDATAEFCVQCASPGHRAADCLAVVCRFCKTSAHRTFSCPARQRCDKCKQLGHGKRECTEKLKLPADEWECAFCGSRDHADASCHELWRSFAFEAYAGTIRKVRHLPAYCYSCGEEGHHGGVCPLSSKRTKEGPFETWSQANFDKYVDPTTTEIAINFADDVSQAYVTPTDRPDLGKSIVPQRHVFFEDASDDEEEFIRPPVQKAQRVSYISFSSSRSGNQQGDRFGGGGARGPSGLPPHIPPPSFQGRDRRDGGGGGWRGKGRR